MYILKQQRLVLVSISVGTKEQSSEQQGHTGDDAVTHSATHLVHSLVPRPDFSQQQMYYITATRKVGLGKWSSLVVLRVSDFRCTIRMQCSVTSRLVLQAN